MKNHLLLSWFLLFLIVSTAQDVKTDSVLKVISKQTGDSTEVNSLIWLGKSSSAQSTEQSLSYFNKALALSKRNKLNRSSAEICNELGRLYHSIGQNDSSLLFYHKAITYSSNENQQRLDAYLGLSINFLWLTQFDSTKFYLTSAQDLAEQIKDYPRLAGIYNSWGNLHLQEGDKTEALKKYIYTAKLQDSLIDDALGKATALANIGNVQYLMGNFNNAIENIKESQALAESKKFEKVLAYTSQLIGRIYRKQKKLGEALEAYQKALSVYIRMGLKREACETYLSIGNIHFDSFNFKEANNQYATALNISKEISNDQILGIAYSAIGNTLMRLKNYDEAILYMDSAYTIGKKTNDQYTILDSYEVLSKIFESKKMYKESLHNFQEYSNLKDSLNEAVNRGQLEELEMKYQNEKKTAEIEFLKSDKALSEVNLSRQRVLQIGTTVALLSVIIISVLLVNRYRVISKAKRLLEIERVRNNIARDLHDDIGSTLSSINILSKVAMIEPSSNTQNYLQRIGDQSTRIMEDMGDIVWSINPRNDSMDKIITRMREFLTEIFEPLNIEYKFLERIDKSFVLDSEKRKNLFLIFKESINNAIKYSDATLFEISLTKNENTLVMIIKDNGKGFDEQIIKAGNGLRNLRERSQEVGGNITLKSIINEGTKLEFTLPIT